MLQIHAWSTVYANLNIRPVNEASELTIIENDPKFGIFTFHMKKTQTINTSSFKYRSKHKYDFARVTVKRKHNVKDF